MKSGWPTKQLGELCALTSGGTPPKDNPRFWVGDIPFVSARDLKSDSIKTAFLHISREAVEQSATKVAPVGSLLMLVRGMGLANGVQIGEVTAPVAFNQDIRAIHPPLASIVPRFLLLALRSSFIDGEGGRVLSAAAHGTLKIDADVLHQILIPVPPIPEQQRIVAILDEAFAGIATAKANAEKNLQNAREVFDTALAEIFGNAHDTWVNTVIGECIHFIDYRGKTPIKTASGLRLITAKNVKMGHLQRDPEEFVSPDSFDSWMTRGIPGEGDVLFTTEAPCGNVAQLDTSEKVVFAQRIIIMQPDEKRLNNTFLKYALLSPPLQKRIQAKATGATALGIKASLLRTIEMSFPKELKEQLRIVAKFDSLRNKVSQLETLHTRKLAALDELKQSLLQQAFSGQI